MQARHTTLFVLPLLLALAAPVGCLMQTDDQADAFRQALSDKEQIQIKVPGATTPKSGDGLGTSQQALLGERAELYLVTRDISTSVNHAAYHWLSIVDDIAHQPPTSIENGVATWGSHTPALSLITYLFVMTDGGNGSYHYVLQGKVKNQPNHTYLPIIEGVSTPGTNDTGTGNMQLHFSNAKALDPTLDASGEIGFTYEDKGTHWQLDVGFMAFVDHEGDGPIDALYHYLEYADESGDFSFLTHSDIQEDSSADETWFMHSRWLSGGSGRSDVVIAGGDLGEVEVYASECWDELFARTYWTIDPQYLEPTEGAEESCVFPAAFPQPQ